MIDKKIIESVEILDDYNPKEVFKAIQNELEYLPDKFHEEFVCDLLINSGPQSPKTISKNGDMFLNEIYNELEEEEKNKMFRTI